MSQYNRNLNFLIRAPKAKAYACLSLTELLLYTLFFHNSSGHAFSSLLSILPYAMSGFSAKK